MSADDWGDGWHPLGEITGFALRVVGKDGRRSWMYRGEPGRYLAFYLSGTWGSLDHVPSNMERHPCTWNAVHPLAADRPSLDMLCNSGQCLCGEGEMMRADRDLFRCSCGQIEFRPMQPGEVITYANVTIQNAYITTLRGREQETYRIVAQDDPGKAINKSVK